jgi:hypothetical protein
MRRTQKLSIVLIFPTMINPKTGFCVVICVLKLHFLVATLTISSLLLVNLTADSNAAAVRTVSEDKDRENPST